MTTKLYMIYYIENYESLDEVFSSPEKALEYMSKQDGRDYILNREKTGIYDLHPALYYLIMEKEVDPKPILILGPTMSNGDIPIHYEFEKAEMIEVRKRDTNE